MPAEPITFYQAANSVLEMADAARPLQRQVEQLQEQIKRLGLEARARGKILAKGKDEWKLPETFVYRGNVFRWEKTSKLYMVTDEAFIPEVQPEPVDGQTQLPRPPDQGDGAPGPPDQP